MSSLTIMIVLFILLAVALVSVFTVLWLKDRDRVHEEAFDEERLDTAPDPDRTSSG